ncbi:BofC C-terminal domain-containing protein [Priestia iocasae]|uniref:Forespore regulator of the sigma-K checkpoint n=1 Tax=Priestia iocasae TaxID=2291674 RepID=A0ABS2QS85_9BACI|nr:BofC C-terminal domain-containing protein [Metabacillus iocasae]MBM7701389.1 forespore regulator of the sigma-K checkpoint [Metabacillus iocasae]
MKKLIHQVTLISVIVVGSYLASVQLVFADNNQPVTIFLERVYVDGVVSQEVMKKVNMTKAEIEQHYREWRLLKETDTELVFRTSVDDISPLLKTNGYVGISIDGILSIYEGKPEQSQRVIQSFFQIDVDRLESYQHQQLKSGIRIRSKDEYVSLINFYKMFEAADGHSL